MRLSELQSNEEKDKGEKTSDPRLKSEQFRRDVRLVFADLDIENTGANFRKYDSIIDWVEYAENLRATGYNVIWNGIGCKVIGDGDGCKRVF